MKISKTNEKRSTYGMTLPVVEIAWEALLDCAADGDVCEVDGESYYYFDCAGEYQYLTKTASAMDAGDNVIRERQAPKSLDGITKATISSRRLTLVGGACEFFVDIKTL